jgi:hypothetical protein
MVITVKMEKVPSVVVFLKMKYLMSNPIAKFLRVWNLYVRIKNGSSYDFEEVEQKRFALASQLSFILSHFSAI